MTFPLVVSERIIVFIRSLAKVTWEHPIYFVVRVFDMPSTIWLITELFSTLSAFEAISCSQNMAAKTWIEKWTLGFLSEFSSSIKYYEQTKTFNSYIDHDWLFDDAWENHSSCNFSGKNHKIVPHHSSYESS